MTNAQGDTRDGDRSIVGIAVHLVGLVFGVLGVVPVYLLSRSEFSKSNARHALNWQLFVLFALLALLGAFFVVTSDPVGVTLGFLVFALLLADFAFSVFATFKALRGSAWSYPLGPDLV